MQKLFATALTFVLLLSLATTSLGQIQTATKREAAEAPPADAPIIDPSKVKFLMATCSQQYETEAGVYFRSVHGIVAPDIDLIQDLTVRRLLQMATEFAQNKCPSQKQFSDISIALRPGDPSAFTDPKIGFEFERTGNWTADLLDLMQAETGRRDQLGWDVLNWPKGRKIAELSEAAQARQVAQQQRAEDRARNAELASVSAALKKFNVTQVVNGEQLSANPFAYKGKVICVYAHFAKMISETRAIFECGNHSFVLSGLSSSRFTSRDTSRWVLIVGRVLGNTEIKTGFGSVDTPHISFVGTCGM